MGMNRETPQLLLDNSGRGLGYEDRGGTHRRLLEVEENLLTGGMVFSNPSGGTMSIPINQDMSNAITVKHISTGPAALGAASTLVQQGAAPSDFFAVGLIYANYGASPYTITAVKAAAAEQTAMDGTTLSQLTVSLTNGGVVPAGSGSGVNAIPGFLEVLAFAAPSLNRTDDATKKKLLQTRSQLPSGAVIGSITPGEVTAFDAATTLNGGYQYGMRAPGGDHTTTIDAWATNPDGAWLCPAAVRFYSTAPGYEIAVCGDSRNRGTGSTANACGTFQQAVVGLETAKPNRVFAINNWAVGGQTHEASLATLRAILTLTKKPKAIVFSNWSYNNGAASQAVMDQCWGNMLIAIDECIKAGVLPIIPTSITSSTLANADNDRVLAQNARTLLLDRTRICVIDVASVAIDPANQRRILPAYDSGDAIHVNQVCHTACGALATTTIGSYLA